MSRAREASCKVPNLRLFILVRLLMSAGCHQDRVLSRYSVRFDGDSIVQFSGNNGSRGRSCFPSGNESLLHVYKANMKVRTDNKCLRDITFVGKSNIQDSSG